MGCVWFHLVNPGGGINEGYKVSKVMVHGKSCP